MGATIDFAVSCAPPRGPPKRYGPPEGGVSVYRGTRCAVSMKLVGNPEDPITGPRYAGGLSARGTLRRGSPAPEHCADGPSTGYRGVFETFRPECRRRVLHPVPYALRTAVGLPEGLLVVPGAARTGSWSRQPQCVAFARADLSQAWSDRKARRVTSDS